MSPEFLRIAVRPSRGDAAERVLAEAWAAGCSGAEERDTELWLYAPAGRASAVRDAARRAAAGEAVVDEIEPVPDVAWSERWKDGLRALEISARLVVRPSFVEFEPRAGQQEVVVDPGQAFGTGGHASTRLALEWVDALVPRIEGRSRVLDVGTGSAVLALAALRLGATQAVGLDLDLVAVREARETSHRNQLSSQLQLFAGPIAALSGRFDVVFANLLRRELLPIAEAVASCVRAEGHLVLSGLLDVDSAEVCDAMAAYGLRLAGRREEHDGGDTWVGLHLRPAGA